MYTRFDVIDKENVILQCHYCELKINKVDVVLDKRK